VIKLLRKVMKATPGLAPTVALLSRRFFYFRHNARDIYDSYLAPSLAPKPTPLGFMLGGLGSQHHRAMQDGSFEPAEVRCLTQLMQRADVFVDVGANIGYYTCLARSLGKCAIAIEPMRNNLRCLLRNLQTNGWTDTEVIPTGVSDRIGIATLYGASSTGASLIDQWAGAPSSIHRLIPVSTLDAVLGERFPGSRLLIKVDVEGLEHQVLAGSGNLLRREVKPVWLIEITHHEYYPGGRNPFFEDVFRSLWEHGYESFLLHQERLRSVSASDVARWTSQGHTDTPAISYVFAPPGFELLPQETGAQPA
jgi:FkbM family methyltransferase